MPGLAANEDYSPSLATTVPVGLDGQACARGWDVVQLDPARRASRYFRQGERLHPVRPDAFGVLRRGQDTLPLFMEWERRLVRPVTRRRRWLLTCATVRPAIPWKTTANCPSYWWCSTTTWQSATSCGGQQKIERASWTLHKS